MLIFGKSFLFHEIEKLLASRSVCFDLPRFECRGPETLVRDVRSLAISLLYPSRIVTSHKRAVPQEILEAGHF